jgi:hypothetical protein
MHDGVVGVLPVLRERPTPLDLGAAYREWEEAGMPGPTPEEIEGYEREIRTWPEVVSADKRILAPNLPPRSPALLLATARDTIRPPAKALTVPNRNLPDSQEPFPVFKNLALPPLELSVPS